MSTSEANKVIASDFFYATAARNLDRLDAILSSEMTYWSIGDSAVTHDMDKAMLLAGVGPFVDRFGGTLRYEILGTIAEGDRVAVEARSFATLADGRQYRNSYHTIFKIHDGRIVSIREYLDTKHTHDLLD